MKRSSTFQIRARFDETTVRIYQAFPAEIARPALAAGRLVAPFKLSRMTWIKPSFNWMMYRSGYAKKPDQEFVLGIDISREGFEWALERAVLSTFHPETHLSPGNWKNLLHESPVRIQWDPERDWRLQIIDDVRTIQIGLAGEAVRRYVDDWIINIEDLTPLSHSIADHALNGTSPESRPDQLEMAYPLRSELIERLIPSS
jgi:Domain of unknown function (DUF4291)